jgi:exodeoxyribonuclease V alpha subunit
MTEPIDVLNALRFDSETGNGLFENADIVTAAMLARRANCTDETVLLALGLSVWAHRNGHACLNLDTLTDDLGRAISRSGQEWVLPTLPTAKQFDKALRASPLVRVLDVPGTSAEALADTRPLVLIENRFSSQRQFADEVLVAESVRALIAHSDDVTSPAAVALIDRELEVSDDDARQNELAKSVLARSFNVLTGGPGTGKTYTLTRCLLAFLVAAEEQGHEVSVAVAAPTGKAATRAKELLNEFADTLEKSESRPSDAVLAQLRAIKPTTIHGLLGSKWGLDTRFAHDRERPLNHDLVIIDETSMVPLQLMARLFEALGSRSRLLLVGDDAQLESVESGSVLRDLVSSAALLDGRVFELQKVRRITGDNPIATVAPMIRKGEAETALAAIQNSGPQLTFVEMTAGAKPASSVIDALVTTYREVRNLARSSKTEDHAKALEQIAGSRLLCGMRRGPLGIDQWNDIIDRRLQLRSGDLMVPGRALLVTVNSPRVGLVNGDIGVVVETEDGPKVCFRTNDEPRYISTVDLPPVERAFAMTVHKSQGSEYKELVVLMLPNEGSPLLTRELLYTGLTRAGGNAVVIGSADALTNAVNNPSVRVSGLAALLQALPA